MRPIYDGVKDLHMTISGIFNCFEKFDHLGPILRNLTISNNLIILGFILGNFTILCNFLPLEGALTWPLGDDTKGFLMFI